MLDIFNISVWHVLYLPCVHYKLCLLNVFNINRTTHIIHDKHKLKIYLATTRITVPITQHLECICLNEWVMYLVQMQWQIIYHTKQAPHACFIWSHFYWIHFARDDAVHLQQGSVSLTSSMGRWGTGLCGEFCSPCNNMIERFASGIWLYFPYMFMETLSEKKILFGSLKPFYFHLNIIPLLLTRSTFQVMCKG